MSAFSSSFSRHHGIFGVHNSSSSNNNNHNRNGRKPFAAVPCSPSDENAGIDLPAPPSPNSERALTIPPGHPHHGLDGWTIKELNKLQARRPADSFPNAPRPALKTLVPVAGPAQPAPSPKQIAPPVPGLTKPMPKPFVVPSRFLFAHEDRKPPALRYNYDVSSARAPPSRALKLAVPPASIKAKAQLASAPAPAPALAPASVPRAPARTVSGLLVATGGLIAKSSAALVAGPPPNKRQKVAHKGGLGLSRTPRA